MSEELVKAAKSGDLDKVNQLIAGGSIDINYQDNGDNTALIWAAYKGREDVVKALIEAGAKLDIQDNGGETALTLASWKGHKGVAKALSLIHI